MACTTGDPAQLTAERERQHWLDLRLGGLRPRTVPAAPLLPATEPWTDRTVLWLDAPDGWPADAPENQMQGGTLLDGLAGALRLLHGVGIDPLLPAVTNDDLVDAARRRVAAGTVDTTRFDRSRRHVAPSVILEQVERLAAIVARRRPVADTVVHGACRLEAVWLHGDRAAGFLDAAGLAVGDPYRDLAGLARSLAGRFGPEGLPRFFAGYGLTDPDPVRLEFHALLDELR